MFINSLSKILCSDFHLMSAFEKTRYIFDQSIWECNGHFDHWFSNIKSFLCGIWNLRKEKLYPRGLFNEYSFKQLRRETRGQWQKCYGKASMSIYYYYYHGFNEIHYVFLYFLLDQASNLQWCIIQRHICLNKNH